MSTYGLQSTGFVLKPLATIKAEIEASLKAALGASLNVSSASTMGQIIGIVAAVYAELWQLAEAVHRGQYPDSASDEALDNVCALTGVTRLAATKSKVTLRLTLNAGVTVPVGSIARIGTTGPRWVTTAAATNSGGAPATVDVAAEAEVTGPTAGNAGTITTIVTPVSGWTAVTNPADATLGTSRETDAALRLRRAQLLRAAGSATVEAIKADVLAVTGVTEAIVYENVTMATDADGVPAKAFEVIVLGGSNADLAKAIWESKPAGIEAHGTTSQAHVDSQGISRTMKFTRPTAIPIHIAITIVKDAAKYPADGDTQIKTALANFGTSEYGIGDDVIAQRVKAIAFNVSGVVDVTVFKIDTVSPPVATGNVVINRAQVATFNTANIAVTVT